jgi:hypothetical protein
MFTMFPSRTFLHPQLGLVFSRRQKRHFNPQFHVNKPDFRIRDVAVRQQEQKCRNRNAGYDRESESPRGTNMYKLTGVKPNRPVPGPRINMQSAVT